MRTSGPVLLVLLLVAAPLTLVYWLAPGSRSLEDAALVHELLVYPSVLVAGTLFYACWRVGQESTMGWLAFAVILVGAQGLGSAAVHLARPEAVADHLEWQAAIDIALQGVLVLLTVLATRQLLPVDPLACGLLAAIAITVVRAFTLELPAAASPAQLDVLAAVLFVTALLTAALLLRLPRSPQWVRTRVAVAIVVLAISHLLVPPAPIEGPGSDAVSVALTVAGAVLLAATGYRALQQQLARQQGAERGLRDQIEHLEADVRVDRARLHEINATLAGIAHASRLLHSSALPAQARRRDLERMIDLEMARLQRLMEDRRRDQLDEVLLDTVVEPLVVAHRTRGRVVRWSPTGAWVRCRPDDLAEVVNILLENAAQHAGTDVDLEVHEDAGRVEIHVADSGPGVDPEMEPRLFQWGARGSSSRGQGIGLSVAQRLMSEQDGDLRLARDGSPGARFVVTVAEGQPPAEHHSGGTREGTPSIAALEDGADDWASGPVERTNP